MLEVECQDEERVVVLGSMAGGLIQSLEIRRWRGVGAAEKVLSGAELFAREAQQDPVLFQEQSENYCTRIMSGAQLR